LRREKLSCVTVAFARPVDAAAQNASATIHRLTCIRSTPPLGSIMPDGPLLRAAWPA
jgi:hypothetical protein